MPKLVISCLLFLVISYGVDCDVSTKLDFGNEDDGETAVRANTTNADDDVEIKHTIVVSTKYKNYNQRGLHGNNDDSRSLTNPYYFGTASPKPDTGEVPVYRGMKAVETTRIRTPDTRHKNRNYPESIFITRNIRDDYDTYPNIITNPIQWRPSNLYNNINWSGADASRSFLRRVDETENYNKIQKKNSDEAVKEFYCKRCRELSGQKGCIQQKSSPWVYQTTTPKVKIDGKLAKLN